MPRMAEACSKASSAVLASLTPPALPRPPALTCALTTQGPIFSAAARASSAVVTTTPSVVFTPCLAKSSFAWYSIRSTFHQLRERTLVPARRRAKPGRGDCRTADLRLGARRERDRRPRHAAGPSVTSVVVLHRLHARRLHRRRARLPGLAVRGASVMRTTGGWDAFIGRIGPLVMGTTTYLWAHEPNTPSTPSSGRSSTTTARSGCSPTASSPHPGRRRPLRPGRRRAGVRRDGRGRGRQGPVDRRRR